MLAGSKGMEPVMTSARASAWRRSTIALGLAGMVLGACGGEVPELVQVIRPTDSDMSCMDLLHETSDNNLTLARLVDRDDQVHRRNVHYTVIDGIMVPPAMLTLDRRDQANKEANVVRARNDRLMELADKQGC